MSQKVVPQNSSVYVIADNSYDIEEDSKTISSLVRFEEVSNGNEFQRQPESSHSDSFLGDQISSNNAGRSKFSAAAAADSCPEGFIEKLLLLHKGIGFNVREFQIKHGCKRAMNSSTIRNAVLNIGPTVLCQWKSRIKEYFLKCPPARVPLTALQRFDITYNEYFESYYAESNFLPLDLYTMASEFVKNKFLTQSNSIGENDDRGAPIITNSYSLGENRELEDTGLSQEKSGNWPTSSTGTVSYRSPPIDNVSSSIDKAKPTTGKKRKVQDSRASTEHANGQRVWRDYTHFVAIDESGKCLGMARYMIPTSQTTKKRLATFRIDADLNEDGQIVTVFKENEK